MEKFNLKIEKIGRKWVECKDKYNRIFKVEINDYIRNLIKDTDGLGIVIAICGELHNKSTRYGVNRMIINVSSTEEFDKIQEVKKEENKKAFINRKIEHNKEKINKMLSYIETNLTKYWYANGEKVALESIEELKSYGIGTVEYKNRLNALKEQYRCTNNKKQKFTTNEFCKLNSIVKRNNKYIKITECKKVKLTKDDIEAMFGGCFVDDDEDYYKYRTAYEYTYIEATEEEILQFEKEEQEKNAEIETKKEKIKTKEKTESTLLEYIYANCADEQKSEELEQNIKNATKICEISNRISIKKQNNIIYLLEKNWEDWDNWEYNNCNIGICKTCILTDELQALLDKYLTAKEAIKY